MKRDTSLKKNALTYEQAGVSIAAQDAAIELIKPLAEATHTPRVLSAIGAFGGAYKADFEQYDDPILVASTDSVGTKVKLAARFDAWENVGKDLVAVSVNDVITTGAAPLFFLDYIACNKLDPKIVERVVSGVRDGCLECGCSLLGGELAEMGDVYGEGEIDLVGFAVGVVDSRRRIDGSGVVAGDIVFGLPSSGVHSNGYSLVRKAFESLPEQEWRTHDDLLDCSLAEELLKPTTIYCRHIKMLQDAEIEIKAVAHISGGGIPGNAARMLPPGLDLQIKRSEVPVHPIFRYIAEAGGVEEAEMWSTFNMGIGCTLVAAPEQAEAALSLSENGIKLLRLGRIVPGSGNVLIE
jgi:phosphoribosylformylglycinamidine cyclo-ligase